MNHENRPNRSEMSEPQRAAEWAYLTTMSAPYIGNKYDAQTPPQAKYEQAVTALINDVEDETGERINLEEYWVGRLSHVYDDEGEPLEEQGAEGELTTLWITTEGCTTDWSPAGLSKQAYRTLNEWGYATPIDDQLDREHRHKELNKAAGNIKTIATAVKNNTLRMTLIENEVRLLNHSNKIADLEEQIDTLKKKITEVTATK